MLLSLMNCGLRSSFITSLMNSPGNVFISHCRTASGNTGKELSSSSGGRYRDRRTEQSCGKMGLQLKAAAGQGQAGPRSSCAVQLQALCFSQQVSWRWPWFPQKQRAAHRTPFHSLCGKSALQHCPRRHRCHFQGSQHKERTTSQRQGNRQI